MRRLSFLHEPLVKLLLRTLNVARFALLIVLRHGVLIDIQLVLRILFCFL